MIKILLNQKVAQNITISLGYFIFSKIRNKLPKVAQSMKNTNLVTLVKILRITPIME
jgi:hypothetical protein